MEIGHFVMRKGKKFIDLGTNISLDLLAYRPVAFKKQYDKLTMIDFANPQFAIVREAIDATPHNCHDLWGYACYGIVNDLVCILFCCTNTLRHFAEDTLFSKVGKTIKLCTYEYRAQKHIWYTIIQVPKKKESEK
jgi:hypothetical protein